MTPEHRAALRAAVDARVRELTARRRRVIERPDFPHATTTGYSYGCRCVGCAQASRSYQMYYRGRAASKPS